MVLCAANHSPVAIISPIDGHHAQAARMRAQWAAPRPLFKQLWQKIVIAKISVQASLLAAQGRDETNALLLMARRARSGDSSDESSGGTDCVMTCRSRWSRCVTKKKRVTASNSP